MATRQMMIEGVMVLELQQRDKDKDGNPLKNKQGALVTYNTLVCYEPGNQYPELLKISVNSQFVSSAQTLVGRRCNLLCDCMTFGDKLTLYFNQGSPVPATKAA